MIVTPDMIAAAGRAAAARGLPGIPPYIVEAMLRAAVDPPEGDELPPVPLGVPTVLRPGWIRGQRQEGPASVNCERDSEQDVGLQTAMREGRVIRIAEGRGKRAKVSFWKAVRRTARGTSATFWLERAV